MLPLFRTHNPLSLPPPRPSLPSLPSHLSHLQRHLGGDQICPVINFTVFKWSARMIIVKKSVFRIRVTTKSDEIVFAA